MKFDDHFELKELKNGYVLTVPGILSRDEVFCASLQDVLREIAKIVEPHRRKTVTLVYQD